ncbi:NAD(P)/FAD-dependent oxidoreductase [Amphritea pacifica]|uniref:NAD(P)/FAD-dependent oxidoreductase n=1 Tax=Amphritea pacifica TaxID=2811233 RepID=A0ABS2W3L6_9GAMM|nr:FAD/NAD(P)-binding oxidoreductase [Amphritea pacifica]MBN0986315.1 NAD(P)/FAD-dependent oxidoreductase [Amphritea pacifica]MBN1007008.1 NAD(P)/FAD-dependent oxidoreductase [Amphritea pacifica]
MAHIIILGAGLGGVPMAYEMKDLAGPDDTVTIVSDKDYYHFVPSNPWVAVDWRKRSDITVPLAPPMAKKGVELVVSAAKRVHPETSELELSDGTMLSYDHLIIATGPKLAFDEIEGFGPEGFTNSVCHIDHAEVACEQWKALAEKPAPIIVGAVQGASCFGPAYETAFIMDSDLRKRKIRDQIPMTFVTSEPYIGHLGLDGVGDSKTMLESELRQHHIDWICNAKVDRIEDGLMHVIECDEQGEEKKRHELPFGYTMMLPAFTGIDAVRDIEGLVNPRGFIVIDKHQRNPKYPNIWGIGVAVAIAPKKPTPVPTGVPKTGFMIESMVTATAHNIRAVLDNKEPESEATWNAVCLADMGDSGIAFVAMPQIPPRNVNWMKSGKWVHLAKVGFEKYFMHKIRSGVSEPIFEKFLMKMLNIDKLKK